MKFEININTFLIVAGIAVILWFRGCGENTADSPHADTLRTETTYRFDTVIHLVHTHKIYYKPAEKPDSSQIIEIIPENYVSGSPVAFEDSLIDSSYKAAYSGVIWDNHIFYPKFSIQNLRPTEINTTTVIQPKEPRFKAFLGGFVSSRDVGSFSAGGLISLQNKRDNLITIGYGYPQTYFIGYQGKIRLKK